MSKRIFLLLLAACLVAGGLCAANDPFLGNWKLKPSKSKLSDQMKVEKVEANKYAFDFVGEGNAEPIVIDGTDQPASGGTTLSVAAERPDAWKVIRKKDGRMLLTANWKLSKDGNTLTDEFTGMAANGSASTVNYVYKRKGTGSGFAGTWVSTNMAVDFDYVLQFRPYEGDGLSIDDSYSGLTRNLKLDGKDYPNLGQSAVIITTSALRLLDEHTLELTDKRGNGEVFRTQEIKLSSDLKTLMITQHIPGRTEPNIFVFERQ